jgi:hypothetical protein
MIFRLKQGSSSIVRPRVTPDPDQAAELQRRMSTLSYCPQNGFHRDQLQRRQGRVALRAVR